MNKVWVRRRIGDGHACYGYHGPPVTQGGVFSRFLVTICWLQLLFGRLSFCMAYYPGSLFTLWFLTLWGELLQRYLAFLEWLKFPFFFRLSFWSLVRDNFISPSCTSLLSIAVLASFFFWNRLFLFFFVRFVFPLLSFMLPFRLRLNCWDSCSLWPALDFADHITNWQGVVP